MMMKRLILVLLVLVTHSGIPGRRTANEVHAQAQVTTRTLRINSLEMMINDRGNLTPGRGERGGVQREYGWASSDIIVWDHGPWIIGKIDGALAMGASFYMTSYAPGPVIDGRPGLDVRPEDSLRYHPYRIGQMSSSQDSDFVQWPGDLGAPTTSTGAPLLLGDELVWAVFNGADSTAYPSSTIARPFAHLPVEVQQAIYAREAMPGDTSLFASSAFLEWTFINKSTSLVESCYVGLWTDIDLGTTRRNPFAVDTTVQLGYCWDGAAVESLYTPPAVGYALLYGPTIPSPDSTAIVRGGSRPGLRNLPLSSFWGMQNDVGLPPNGPSSIENAWNLARGYDEEGNVIVDSVTMHPTKFPWSGDPVTRTGWLYAGSTEGGAGFMMFSGPFTFAPGDTQWVMLAFMAAGGKDSLERISTLRGWAKRLRQMTYDEIAEPRTVAVRPGDESLPHAVLLCQNYPNPFNSSTTIRYSIPHRAHVSLSVFNTLGQQVAQLENGEREVGYHEAIFDASGLSSGVYFYRLQAGRSVETKKLLLTK
jgi:hypothetical protein